MSRPSLLLSGLLMLLPLRALAVDSPQINYKANMPFDEYGTSLKDEGVAVIPLADGKSMVVARVDVANVDPRVVGIGLARRNIDGSADYGFQSGRRVKDAGFSSIVGACVMSNGTVIVAGTTPHSSSQYSGHHLALAAFNADGSDNLGFSGDGKANWNAGSVFNYTATGVNCGGNVAVILGSEATASGIKYAVAASFGANGIALGANTVAGAAYNDEMTAALYDPVDYYSPWLIARRSLRTDGTAEIVIVRRSNYMDAFSGSNVWTTPPNCGNPLRVAGIVKATDGAFVATVGSADGNAYLWRFPSTGGVGACWLIPNMDKSVRAPAQLGDGRIGVIDDLSNLQNEGAHARLRIMKRYGAAYYADPAVNSGALIYWLHPSAVDPYGTTFARSIAAMGNQFIVVGTKNYRSPDLDVSFTRILP